MRTDEFDYSLPGELIAQTPLPRGESRMLVLYRETGVIEHRQFSDLPEYLTAVDILVVNDTRVVARRIEAIRPSGLPAEALLLRPEGESRWHALLKPARRVRVGDRLVFRLRDGGEICAGVAGIT